MARTAQRTSADAMHRLVAATRRRLATNAALHRAGVGIIIGAAIALFVLGIDRVLGVLPFAFSPWWYASFVAAGGVAAFLIGWVMQPTAFEAATHVDQRMRTRDRIATAQQIEQGRVRVPRSEGDQPNFSLFIEADAQRVAAKIDPRTAVPLHLTSIWQVSFASSVVLAIAVLFLPNLAWAKPRTTPEQLAAQQQLLEERDAVAEDVASAIEALRGQGDESAVNDTNDEANVDASSDDPLRERLDALDRIADRLRDQEATTPEALREQREEAAAEISDAAAELEERARAQQEAQDELARRFDEWTPPDGPLSTEQLAEKLRNGAFGDAADAIERMLEQREQMTEQQRQELADQLRSLSDAADDLERQASEDAQLAERIEQLRDALREQGVDDQTIDELLDDTPTDDAANAEEQPPAEEEDVNAPDTAAEQAEDDQQSAENNANEQQSQDTTSDAQRSESTAQDEQKQTEQAENQESGQENKPPTDQQQQTEQSGGQEQQESGERAADPQQSREQATDPQQDQDSAPDQPRTDPDAQGDQQQTGPNGERQSADQPSEQTGEQSDQQQQQEQQAGDQQQASDSPGQQQQQRQERRSRDEIERELREQGVDEQAARELARDIDQANREKAARERADDQGEDVADALREAADQVEQPQDQSPEGEQQSQPQQPDQDQAVDPNQPEAQQEIADAQDQPQQPSEQQGAQEQPQLPGEQRQQGEQAAEQQQSDRTQSPAERLREMQRQREQAEQDAQDAERLRDIARRMAENMSPEERQRWMEQFEREQGEQPPDQPRDASGQQPQPPPSQDDQQPGDRSSSDAPLSDEQDGTGRDIRPGDQPGRDTEVGSDERQFSPEGTEDVTDSSDDVAGETIAELMGDGDQTGEAADAPSDRLAKRVREAQRVAERAVNESAVPRRYHDLIRKYFGRVGRKAEGSSNSGGSSEAPSEQPAAQGDD